jgi:hypothetical protein
MVQVQQIVDSMLPDVPLQRRKKPEKPLENNKANGKTDTKDRAQKSGFMLQVVDRDAFALELAREWVRSGLPRTPVR